MSVTAYLSYHATLLCSIQVYGHSDTPIPATLLLLRNLHPSLCLRNLVVDSLLLLQPFLVCLERGISTCLDTDTGISTCSVMGIKGHTSDVIREFDGLNRILSDSVDSLLLFS